MSGKMIGVLVAIVLVVILLAQNVHVVPLNLFFWSIELPLLLWTLILLVIGFILGYVVAHSGRSGR